jgi:tetratricopeptide (TPR) repeat protein
MRRIFLPALLGLCAAASAAGAQGSPAPADPPRPKLDAAADTNDAAAYFRNGVHVLYGHPAEAAASFHWARRINPGMSDAFYGERTALMMSDRQRLLRYLRGDRRVRPAMRQLDSLYDRAATADPFLQPRLDYVLIDFAGGVAAEDNKVHGNPGRAALAFSGGRVSAPVPSCEGSEMDPGGSAWRAFTNGCFGKAVELYDVAIRRSRPSAELQVERARALFLAGRYDEALTGMRQGVTLWKKDDEDKDSVVFRYRSKAHLEESVGIIQEKMGDKAGARDSYGRALTEDLSYFPAHVRLAALSLAAGDTAGAIGELDLAVQIQPNDGALRYNYGFVLGTAKKFVEAAEQFRKATELEPWFAGPYYMLARIYDASGMEAEATQSYRAFVARAARRDPYLLIATQRLAELTEAATPATVRP